MATVNMKDYYLSFRLGSELYAIVVYDVLEVLPMQVITPVPKAPEAVLGIINFRGEIIPVIDFKTKLSIRTNSDVKRAIIVLEVTMRDTKFYSGILVDGVSDVLEISLKDIKHMPEMGVEFKAEFLTGVYRSEETFISILDINKIFSEEEIMRINENVTDTNATV